MGEVGGKRRDFAGPPYVCKRWLQKDERRGIRLVVAGKNIALRYRKVKLNWDFKGRLLQYEGA
jgi:hypothetical protein